MWYHDSYQHEQKLKYYLTVWTLPNNTDNYLMYAKLICIIVIYDMYIHLWFFEITCYSQKNILFEFNLFVDKFFGLEYLLFQINFYFSICCCVGKLWWSGIPAIHIYLCHVCNYRGIFWIFAYFVIFIYQFSILFNIWAVCLWLLID